MGYRIKMSTIFGSVSFMSIAAAIFILLTGAGGSNADRVTPGVRAIDRGVQLFIDEGCIRCHGHERAMAEVEGLETMRDTGAYGSSTELTGYDADPAFLREWLADPASVRPETTMPNPNLTDREIEMLMEFLLESEGTG